MVKALAYFVLALLIVGAIAAHWLGERARALAMIDKRLQAIAPTAAPERDPQALAAISVPDRLAPLLAQAQVEVTGPMLRMIVLGTLLAAGALLLLAGPVATLALLVGLPLIGHTWLSGRARKRIDALTDAMPLYLDSVRQLQAVGNSLPQALERALADSPETLRSYFAPAARRLAMGAPVAETMQQLADRLRVPEVSMLAAAIRTNLRYGGSIAGVFRNLAHILRERLRIRRELVAATSEAKVSSRVLIAMPLLAMVGLVAMNPAYIDFFIHDERGTSLSMWAIGLELAGILIIRRILRLDF
jgi:tight adherence protein B